MVGFQNDEQATGQRKTKMHSFPDAVMLLPTMNNNTHFINYIFLLNNRL